MKNKNGFTLIELLAVIIILSVIVVFSFPIIGDKVKKSKFKSGLSGSEIIRQRIVDYCEGIEIEDDSKLVCSPKMKPSDLNHILNLGDMKVLEVLFDKELIWLKVEKNDNIFILEDNAMIPYDETKDLKYGYFNEINLAVNALTNNIKTEIIYNNQPVFAYLKNNVINVTLLDNVIETNTTNFKINGNLNLNGFNVKYNFMDKNKPNYFGIIAHQNTNLNIDGTKENSKIEMINSPGTIQILIDCEKNAKLNINGGTYINELNIQYDKSEVVTINNNFGELEIKDATIIGENHHKRMPDRNKPECYAVAIYTHGKTKISGDMYVRSSFRALEINNSTEPLMIDGGTYEGATGTSIFISCHGKDLLNKVNSYIQNVTIQRGTLKPGYILDGREDYFLITLGGGPKSNFNNLFINNVIFNNNGKDFLSLHINHNEHDNDLYISNWHTKNILQKSNFKVQGNNKVYFGRNVNVSDELINSNKENYIKTNEIYVK